MLNAARDPRLRRTRFRPGVLSTDPGLPAPPIGCAEAGVDPERPFRDLGGSVDLESADDELDALVATLRTLPQITQRVLVLRKVYSWSHEQIAARVDLSESAVVQHLVVAALTCMRSAPPGAPRPAHAPVGVYP